MDDTLKERDYVTLGLIALYSQTGYELRKVIEEFVFLYPNIAFSQIYPSLHRLLKGEYVTVKEVEQGGRPNKKIYTATKDGEVVIKGWLSAPITSEGVQSEATFILKELFFPLLSKTEITHIVSTQRERIDTEIKDHTEKEKHYEAMLSVDNIAGIAMVLDFRKRYLNNYLQWLKAIEKKFA